MFIDQHTDEYPVDEMGRVLQVSRSGYSAWRARPISLRQTANDELMAAIRNVHDGIKQRYGSDRVYRQLRRSSWRCGRHRVARLMRHNGLTSKRLARFKVTTNAQHSLPIAANRLHREFTALLPNTKWVSDITFVPTHEGWLYLAVVLDLFSRRVVGWSLNERMTRQLVMDAFTMAAQARQIDACMLFHSDQGSQYASDDFTDLLGVFEITQSMSRTANCWDNAVAESFFASYKLECVPIGGFDTRLNARIETFDDIEVFYNRQRLHATLDYVTPVEFERIYATVAA